MKQRQSLYPNFLRNSVQLFTIAFLVSFVALLSSCAQEGEVDFSGEWSLNKEKSEMGEGRFPGTSKLTIMQEENNFTIERIRKGREGQERKSTQKLTLDGKESESDTGRGIRKYSATWTDNGKILAIKSTMVFNRGGKTMKMKSTEQWKLTGEGKILTIETTSSTPRGERKATLVYNKN